MEVQNTILGNYKYMGKKKIVCACEDFTDDVCQLIEFEHLALSTNPDKKIETELSDILDVLMELSDKISFQEVKNKFFDMFIIDGLIGNTDRYNGNWGFVFNKKTKEIKFSPIYDCGSCLNPMYEDSELEKISDVEVKNLAMNCYSCLKINGKKVPYMSFIRDMKNKDCNDALLRIFSSIDIDKINEFIDNIDCMSEARRSFYKNVICYRYEILRKVYERLSY